jgi:hypothetical protein
MSGGPVFGTDGKIMGMQASVTDPRVSTNGTQTITVQNAMVVSAEKIIILLKAQQIHLN